MKKVILSCLVVLFTTAFAQKSSLLPPGFPDRSPKLNVLPGFQHPPKGYGEVSFYWWLGDTLTTERITSQLDQLKDKGITGLQINYAHSDKGGASFGLTYASQPALFTDKWWSLFQWFLKEAQKRDMSVSLSDYTLGAAGQGWFVDEMLNENPELNGTKLEWKQFDVNDKHNLNTKLPENLLSVNAYENKAGTLQSSSAIDLLSLVQNNAINWKAPAGNWKVIAVYKNVIKRSFDPMNPLSGHKVIEKFYQRFENHCPGESGKGLNFFFSDELSFGISGLLWNKKFAEEFKKRKGYDIVSKVDQLFVFLGSETYKTRMDYNDVLVELSEEGFFKQVYDWHTSRGMLFGCDHGGRGKVVTEFGDYFRTQRWMSGPGCDQPGLGRDIVKNKVASSIAHMYERPRTWLEGFYGSGWGTSSAEVANATFSNFAMGQNLLSLHGLYYSTHGSSWEWAAPDNHFRQPYWENMGDFMKCSERLSYILSQGHHRCDVAIVYPVAPTEANLKGKESTKVAFDLANDLYPKGVDFDFMDFQSLERCVVKNKELQVSGEKYKILILPALSAVRYSTIEKALAFYRSGGIVFAVGALPEASDRIGADDPKLQTMIKEIFGVTFSDITDNSKNYSTKSKSGGIGMYFQNIQDINGSINDVIERDFIIASAGVKSNILHRKLGERDLYFIYGVPKGTECFFRAAGKVELWNPWDGSVKALKVKSVSKTGTTIELPLEKNEPQLIVFNPGTAEIEPNTLEFPPSGKITLDNNWEFELKPTLDNKYGDYRLPAFDSKIGVETWKMKFADENSSSLDCKSPDFDDSNWSTAEVSYGAQFLKLGPLTADADFGAIESKLSAQDKIDVNVPIETNGKQYNWSLYEFSWHTGLKDDAGHQGYHGLKGVINNEIIGLGKVDKTKASRPLNPIIKESDGSVYYLWSTILSPRTMTAKISKGGLMPAKVFVNKQEINNNAETVNLKAGVNTILLKYSTVGRGFYVLEDAGISTDWKQTFPLATDWFLKPSGLPFNCLPQTKNNFGWYRFMSSPGTRFMFIPSKAKPTIWISGVEMPCESTKMLTERLADKNQQVWKVTFPESTSKSSQIVLRIEQLPGYFGGAAIQEPISYECGKGEIKSGDLDKNEALRTYSGGMWYRKTVSVSDVQSSSRSITIDLGDVVASANVYVNGQLVGQKATPPWIFDLTAKLKTGENRIEILVYNTLGNHYLNSFSQYVGRTKSGLIGPVTLQYK